jgi:bisphosphoglycerate-dependent phosphoglycerate mutase
MKTLQEIKALTEAAVSEKKANEQARLAAKEAKEAEKREYDIKKAKEAPSQYMKYIEEEAKQGKRSFEIDMNTLTKDTKYRLELEQAEIAEHLKDFNPKFQQLVREGTQRNFDGDPIGNFTYEVINVSFNW